MVAATLPFFVDPWLLHSSIRAQLVGCAADGVQRLSTPSV